MTISTGFLLYVILYRLTVLAVGAISIYLGFRLFIQPGSGRNRAPDTALADVEAGGGTEQRFGAKPPTIFLPRRGCIY